MWGSMAATFWVLIYAEHKPLTTNYCLISVDAILRRGISLIITKNGKPTLFSPLKRGRNRVLINPWLLWWIHLKLHRHQRGLSFNVMKDSINVSFQKSSSLCAADGTVPEVSSSFYLTKHSISRRVIHLSLQVQSLKWSWLNFLRAI